MGISLSPLNTTNMYNVSKNKHHPPRIMALVDKLMRMFKFGFNIPREVKTTLELFPNLLRETNPGSLRALLVLLEKDLEQTHHYYHNCQRPHRYLSLWASGRRPPRILQPICLPRTRGFGDIHIAFHHVQLFMNSHIYGPGKGFSLNYFEFTVLLLRPGGWVTESLVNIRDGQLIIRMVHKITLSGDPRHIGHALNHYYI